MIIGNYKGCMKKELYDFIEIESHQFTITFLLKHNLSIKKQYKNLLKVSPNYDT
jgi:hypothetical protein